MPTFESQEKSWLSFYAYNSPPNYCRRHDNTLAGSIYLCRQILNWLDSLIAKLGNKVSQERTFLLNARNLYAKALFQTQGSFNAETSTMSPAETTAPAAADGAVNVAGTPTVETIGAVEGTEANELRQIVQEQYARGEISETEFDEMMELIDHQEEESAGNTEQYSINGDFAADISEWYAAGMQSDESFVLGTTGDVLQGLGAIESDIYMLGDKVKSILNDHPEMSIDEIKKIPQILEDPILILKSKNVGRSDRKNTRLVVFGTVTAQNGQPILTVLDLRPQEKNLVIDDMQKVSSAYTKTNDPVAFVKSSDVVYADKKRTAKLLRSIGFQMPIELQQSGYIGSISYFQRSVNITGKNLADVFTTGETVSTEQFSIRDQVSKRDVVSDLREILRRGGDPAELRRYVENMERSTETAAETNTTDSQDAESQEILNAAREQNISVDEYLRRNWEQYEYDGQLNDTARTALDLEKGNVQYSISNSTKKYDYTKSFAEQVDDYKAGLIPKGDTLLLGGTPEVYQSIGFNALPMTINTTHVDYALNGTKDADHLMGETVLKQLPESIKDPVAVFISQTHETTSVIALLNFTVNGKQTVAPIVIDGFGKNNNVVIDSNAVTSVYGKTTAVDQLYQAVKDDATGRFALLYVNKKEAVSLLQRAGHQLSGTLMPHDGFYHSIRENGSPVKPKFNSVTETQQFKRWFGDWQKRPDKASKIVNQDGSPMVMYHGSPAQFTVFDKKKARSSGQYGSGFYFTNSQSHADTYGQEYSVYLNIRNPLEYGRTEVSRGQAETFLTAVAENEDYSIENYGTYDIDAIVETIMGNSDSVDAFKLIQDVNLTAIGDMVEAAELFNQVNNTKFDGIVTATEAVAFYPEQIKSATDNIGTFDGSNPDIRYSISNDQTAEDSDTTSEEQPEGPRSGLPRKAHEFLKRAENRLLNDLGDKLSVPRLARREYLRPIVQEISNEYLRDRVLCVAIIY